MEIQKKIIGNTTLYLGDCLEILSDINDCDMVVTDPPYSSGGLMRSDRNKQAVDKYIGETKYKNYKSFTGDNRDQRSFEKWCVWWVNKLRQKVVTGGYCFFFIDWRNLPCVIDAVQIGGLIYRGIIPWNKGPQARPNKGYFRYQCEYIVWATNGPINENTCKNGFFSCPVNPKEKLHPTQKPLELMIELTSIKKGVVLDPFMGAGTTGVAAIKNGNGFIGIEQDEYWFDIACSRIEQAYKEKRETGL